MNDYGFLVIVQMIRTHSIAVKCEVKMLKATMYRYIYFAVFCLFSSIVNAEPSSALIDSRYVIKGDSVYDKKTNLTWQRCSVGQKWDGARCAGNAERFTFDDAHNLGDQAWRVPTKDELASLIDQNRKAKGLKPMINITVFPNSEVVYWSSTIDTGKSNLIAGIFAKSTKSTLDPSLTHGWLVHFNAGDVFSMMRGGTFAVRLVRVGNHN